MIKLNIILLDSTRKYAPRQKTPGKKTASIAVQRVETRRPSYIVLLGLGFSNKNFKNIFI